MKYKDQVKLMTIQVKELREMLQNEENIRAQTFNELER